MAEPTFLALLLITLFLTSDSDAAQPNAAELRTLLTIERDWGNPTALSSWNNSRSNTTASASFTHCEWAGVTCNDNGQVIALAFQNFNLSHPIPASICSLRNLAYLDLSYNNLTGDFPAAALHGCSSLQYLDLSNNFFSGVLPTDINQLALGMEHLNLSSNGFSGSVPLAIAQFPKLKSLVLDTNSFNGSYPGSAIGNLTKLETLTLATNPFSPGPIPVEFGRLKNLKILWLSDMNLTGVIPDRLSSLIELTTLALYDNKLGGEIPAWVWKLQKLENLYLYANNFTGMIGPGVTAVSMRELDLSANWLSGAIPNAIGRMKNLTLLCLYYNKITGVIPSSIGLLPNLVDIRLFNNMLERILPAELGKHTPLGNLEVSNNFLIGEVPGTLCSNKKLYNIVLFNNNVSGVFPPFLEACDTLDNIMLQDNHFTGEFPEKVWSAFPKLTTVKIQNNNFTGFLPSTLSSNLTRIEIGNNRFSGAIPESATGLRWFDAENNWFYHVPANMTKLANLTDLNLAGNQISGSIPTSMGALERLNYLNLSSNQITGAIPAGIGLLPTLIVLDLSNNQLTGGIPEDFTNNNHFSFLNLSYNQLTGEIPAYYDSFLDNPGLCVGSSSALPLHTCSGGGGPGVGCIMHWRKKGRQDVTSWKMTPFRALDFTEHDVLSNIREENLIGRGGSGKVYRIHLGSQKSAAKDGGDEAGGRPTVAVKKIGNAGKADANLDKEFEAEVASLGGLRHGNIVDLLCCISGGDDPKLLVYEYMENGSLERLSIAVDVARGLSYMHHGFTRPVIHRDVKCSNILLDRGFGAKIADFGLARILARAGESEPTSGICGTFGYIAPEYVSRAKVSEKVDVYSFGVVLLELATGRGPEDGGTESGSCLVKWASKRYKSSEPCADQLVDGEILDPAYLDDMVAVLELGVACTGEDLSSRPPMSEFLRRLLQCGRSQMAVDDDDHHSAKDVCGVDSFECMV
ncbi:receptor-like protein kinase 5 [Panicum miliaceum]|uniref:Receptor-like protein kinase 5 n=1 Tax=Panicum miliaceum TaxID=4540 RepID=A0A3L6QFM6_PANMI|nr:receptor-like protein kinase 5 [Panicum miliaceum]